MEQLLTRHMIASCLLIKMFDGTKISKNSRRVQGYGIGALSGFDSRTGTNQKTDIVVMDGKLRELLVEYHEEEQILNR